MRAAVRPSCNYPGALDEQAFKEADAASYDRYAEAYSRHAARLAGPLADEIVRLAELEPGERVLDVGCGTGIAALRAADSVAPSGSVVGVDLSRGMLEVAERRRSEATVGHLVELSRMDAERLEFAPGSFDAVVSLCAVLHFPDLDRAVAEMRRVVVRGGRVVVALGSGRPNAPLALAAFVPQRVLAAVHAARRPRLRAPHHLLRLVDDELPAATQPLLTDWGQRRPLRRVLGAMRAAGLERTSVHWQGSELRFGDAEDFWEAQLAIATEIRKRLTAADASAVARVRERFLADAGRVLEQGGELVYLYGATFVKATAQS